MQKYPLPPIVAVDFDGTIVSDAFPEIGEPNLPLIRTLHDFQRKGGKTILWTSRHKGLVYGRYLVQEAVDFCKVKFDLHFDAINENIPEVIKYFGVDTRKVYANIYIDSSACSQKQFVEMYNVVNKILGK